MLSRNKKYHQTKIGLVSRIYRNQKRHSKDRGHKPPTYTRQELQDWLFAQAQFHILFDNYKRLDFQKDYAPSVDRIKDSIGYTMANIQLITFRENLQKACENRQFREIKVAQYRKDGVFVKYFASADKASKRLGINQGNIVSCCKGNRKTAGGYIWSYAND